MTAETMRKTLKHDLHEHTLILRKISQNTSIAYRCSLCQRAYCYGDPEPVPCEIENRVYCCEDCGFFIHKWCAEFPPQIQHPSHPQHPSLSLYIGDYSFDYRCGESGCDKYALDAASAIATLPNSEEQDSAGSELKFFGHHHALNFFHVDIITKTKCQLCNLEIRGCSVYGCRVCLFLIHESCAQLPRKIEHHPLHPEHSLTLTVEVDDQEWQLWDYDSKQCKLCDESLMDQASYICYECKPKFGLHANCAIASTAPPSDLVKQDHILRAGEKLISGYLKGCRYDDELTCQICLCLVKPGKSYVCTRDINEQNPQFSSFFVHKTCAELPCKLQHPLCPNSALILSEEEYARSYICCGVCGNHIQGMYYHNNDGNFYMHTRCAVETLTAILKGLATATIQHFAYTDLFFTCYVPGVVWNHKKDKCIACRKPIDEEIGYFCQESSEKIHTSCAEKLEPVIDHPFHPQHPLLVQSSERDIVFCKGCNSDASKSYYYSCGECEFYLDLKCALRKPTLKDPCHQHDLAYFERVEYISCRVCGYCCGYDLYRCVGCNFSVHRDCLHLPYLQDNGSNGTKPEYSHSLKEKIDIVKREIESAMSSIEEYQRMLQRKMATLVVLESLKSGWGET